MQSSIEQTLSDGIFNLGENISENIEQVEVKFKNTQTFKPILEDLTCDIGSSYSIQSLFGNIMKSNDQLQSTGLFQKMNVILGPGEKEGEFQVIYDLQQQSGYSVLVANNVDRRGNLDGKVEIGLKNIFQVGEQLSFEYGHEISLSSNKSYKLSLSVPNFAQNSTSLYSQKIKNWLNRTSFSSLVLGGISQDRHLQEDSSESVQGAFFRLSDDQGDQSIMLESMYRANNIGPQTQMYVKNLDFLPSRQNSITYMRNFSNIGEDKNKIGQGFNGSVVLQCTLPKSEAKFFQLETNIKNLIRLNALKKYSKNFKYINFQQNLGLGVISPWSEGKLYANDCFKGLSLRGFRDIHQGLVNQNLSLHQLNQSFYNHLDFYAQYGIKLNMYNYPVISTLSEAYKGKISAFYHISSLYNYRRRDWISSSGFRASTGFGISLNINERAQIEFLYNIFQYQTNKFEEGVGFQIRVSADE